MLKSSKAPPGASGISFLYFSARVRPGLANIASDNSSASRIPHLLVMSSSRNRAARSETPRKCRRRLAHLVKARHVIYRVIIKTSRSLTSKLRRCRPAAHRPLAATRRKVHRDRARRARARRRMPPSSNVVRPGRMKSAFVRQ